MKQLTALRYYANFPALMSLISTQRGLMHTALRYCNTSDVAAV